MKKLTVAIPIAILCSVTPVTAVASHWGSSDQAKASTPSKNSLGFLGRLVTRSHQKAVDQAPELKSLTGAETTQVMVPLANAAEPETASISATEISTPTAKEQNTLDNKSKEQATPIAPIDPIPTFSSEEPLLATLTPEKTPAIDVPAIEPVKQPEQPMEQPVELTTTEAKRPNFFVRILDAIVPALTPEELDNKPQEPELRTASLPVKDFAPEMPVPEQAKLVVPPPVIASSASDATAPAAIASSTTTSAATPTETAASTEQPADEKTFTLKASMPIHIQLQEWAKDSGWALDWKLDTSWAPPIDTQFSGTFQSVAEKIIDGLHSEGKQIKLIVWANNYAEVVDVSTR